MTASRAQLYDNEPVAPIQSCQESEPDVRFHREVSANEQGIRQNNPILKITTSRNDAITK